MKWSRVEKRLTTIKEHIMKLKDGKIKMYHILNKGETKVIDDFCREHKILHQIIVTDDTFSSFLIGGCNDFYSREDKEYFTRRVYVKVWKGFQTHHDPHKPRLSQLVIHKTPTMIE